MSIIVRDDGTKTYIDDASGLVLSAEDIKDAKGR